MKKLFLLLVFILGALVANVKAQEVKVDWSERQVYDNKLDGFFDYFLGSNSKYVFAKFSNVGKHGDRKIKLVAFDRITMKKAGDVAVRGFKENASSESKYAGLSYYKTVVFENVLYMFWTKEAKNKQELFVQSFDGKLKPLNPLKKVYELTSEPKSKKKSSLFVMGNIKSDERIIMGGEHSGNKDESIKIEYKVLNKDFSFAASNTVALPITITGKSYGLTSNYVFGEDGNLHVTSYVTMDAEDRKGLAKGESARFPIFSVIDLNTGKIKSHSFKFDKKNIFNVDYKIDGGVTKIYAFFCDLDKDPRGYATHGIVYATLNNQTFEVENVNFSYFTKTQLDQLFAGDKEDKKKGKAVFKSKKKAKSDEESLISDYVIEAAESLDRDNLVLFCSRMRNYSVTTCDGKGNCHTNYYCEKRNVTVFKIGKDGSIIWASNLDRSLTYNGWSIEDVRVIHDKDKFFVSYGSGFAMGAKKKNHSSRKSKSYMSDRFEYAVFDYSNGNFTKKEYKINPVNVKKVDRKGVDPTAVKVIDNVFYTNYTRTRVKGWPLIAGCSAGIIGTVLSFTKGAGTSVAGSCLAEAGGALFISPFVIRSLRKGAGYLGKIEPIR
jgi:hypothetical protein